MQRALLAWVAASLVAGGCFSPPEAADVFDAGNVELPCGTAAECACTSDSDCVPTRLFRDINSPADCYCPSCCPAETNASTAAARTASYQAYCSDFDQRWPDGGGCGVCSVSCTVNQPVCDRGICSDERPAN